MWSGQIIETSHNLTPKGSWGREIPLLHGFFFFWLVKYHSIWPDMILLVIKLTFNSVNLQASHQLFCWNVFVRLCHWHQRAGVPHSSVEMWKKNIRWVIFCTIFSTTKIQKNQRNFDQATLATLTTPSFTAPREPIHRILHYLLPRASDLRPGDGPRLGWIYGICRGGIGFGFRYCWWFRIPNNHLGCIKPCK